MIAMTAMTATTATHDGVRHEPIKLRGFVEGVLADFEVLAKSHHVTLNALVFSDEVQADVGLLRRALTGLVAGALRRAPTGTDVSLVVSAHGGNTEFRVADEGAGVPAEALDSVGDGVRDEGSGLTVCRRAVEADGGRLSVIETAAGTVVCLALAGRDGAEVKSATGHS